MKDDSVWENTYRFSQSFIPTTNLQLMQEYVKVKNTADHLY